ncbi:MAG: hypothetical protein HZB26_18865 [Candidatus Hydrogenedentes bacterium]|nr:hypothetical protein [Candidatus Hydrogenedentota bacterium]
MTERASSKPDDNRSYLLARLAEAGMELVVVIGPRDKDDPCLDWVGAVLSVSGRTRGFPTVAQAIKDGLFHPGCRHNLAVYNPTSVTPERAAEARACTLHALAAMSARAAGKGPPPLPMRKWLQERERALADSPEERARQIAANSRLKFERVYEAARRADAEGDAQTTLVKCRAALDILREEDLYGEAQDRIIGALEDMLQKLRSQG